MSPLANLEVFFGEANQAAARVYARLAVDDACPECELQGRVIGPTCAFTRTLSATIRMTPKPLDSDSASADQSRNVPLLAEAVVPDPCFWSPELPFLYEVHVDLLRRGEVLGTAERSIGIRRLGVVRRKLVLEGRVWVPRAIQADEVIDGSIADFKSAGAVMCVQDPTDSLCEEASRLGVLVAAQLSQETVSAGEQSLMATLGRLARWPSIALAVVGSELEAGQARLARPKNLLLAQRFGPGREVRPAEWADAVICEDSEPVALARRVGALELPAIAVRRVGPGLELSAARRACDDLQRELAGLGEFAGYIV
jgi:hypothetical protein